MEKEKNVIFEAFARKAAERIEERKKLRTMRLMVKSVGMEVEIRGLTEEEIRDCMADISVAVANSSSTARKTADYLCRRDCAEGYLDMLMVIETAKRYWK